MTLEEIRNVTNFKKKLFLHHNKGLSINQRMWGHGGNFRGQILLGDTARLQRDCIIAILIRDRPIFQMDFCENVEETHS